MKKFLCLLFVPLMVLAVSCKKDDKSGKGEDSGKYGIDGVTPLPEAVDLGLESGVKWASFNIGASKEYEYGDFYAWGETTPKDNYNWASYKWCTGAENKLTKYCQSGYTDYWDYTAKPEGIDGIMALYPSDDVAHVKLGGKWRMPSIADFEELLALETEASQENSDYTWEKWAFATDADGNEVIDAKGNVVRGIRIKRKSTGATLFLPAAGKIIDTHIYNVGAVGEYWSSSLTTDSPHKAYYMHILSSVATRNYDLRCYGLSVRPVCVE